MNKFVWTKEYSVDVEEIDEQHKTFINIVNDLLDLSSQESSPDGEALAKALKMGDYAYYHLSTEEDLFIQTHYGGAPEHIELHNKFRERAREYINRIRDKNEDKRKVLREMADFCGSWLLNHILVTDKNYSECFHEYGIK